MNEELEEFKTRMENSDDNDPMSVKELSTQVLVFMVRGIFQKLHYPFGYFSSRGMSGVQLLPLTLKAMEVLTSIGFKVRAIVADGASPNRKLFHLLAEEEGAHWFWNPYIENLKTYLFADVPHLLKTTRNCFENSLWNLNTRHLHVSFFSNALAKLFVISKPGLYHFFHFHSVSLIPF